MLVTLAGIVTLVRLVQEPNALSPMLVTGRPVVTGDGEGAVVRLESELGLHYDRQRQQEEQQYFERRFHSNF